MYEEKNYINFGIFYRNGDCKNMCIENDVWKKSIREIRVIRG